MKLQRIFENLSKLADLKVFPKSVIDEGRIFELGTFVNAEELHGRVTDVVEGLKDHIGQPFELHPWIAIVRLSTIKQNADPKPLTFVELVEPQKNGAVFVTQFFALSKGLHKTAYFIYEHTTAGTTIKARNADGKRSDAEQATMSLYPLAIAVLNTRGCRVDLKRAPSIINAKRVKRGKPAIPSHWDVGTAEYLTALGSSFKTNAVASSSHASPIPHLRRAHERELAGGKRIWVSSALVNVRSEADIAFVERRKGYRRDD
ncbi:hypothetical protein [uncultured Roseobacter sp.]|uniref:hypothetical protein n=1 Tax=uncultured Roseobacter sp. TaxID=114847 RepID=UPI002636DC16|nr:hypothetical protein [uncultured Roseobacter sp.]